MKYLIDGYNVLFRESDECASLEEQRNSLFEKLNFLAEASHQNFVVVLDAHQQIGGLERHHYRSLEVVYTDFGQTADEYFIEYIGSLPSSKRNLVKVVTSDKGLIRKVRSERVEVLSISSFFKGMEKKSQKGAKPPRSLLSTKTDKSAPKNINDNASWIAFFEGRER